jgi:hypothetical protein
MSELAVSDTAPRGLRDFQQAFTRYIRDPQHRPAPVGIAPERMQLYAQLVFGNVERVMSNMFPVLKSLLPPAGWLALARAFFRDHDMHDPLFQSMPREFLRFLELRVPTPQDPPYLLELAHWEWVDYALSIDATDIALDAIERDGSLLARRPVLNPLVWMLSYQFPVQRFRDETPLEHAPEEPTYLVAYRDLDDRNAYLQLNAVSARLLELLDGDDYDSGAAILHALAQELGKQGDAEFEVAGREMLESLRERHIILGVSTTPPLSA